MGILTLKTTLVRSNPQVIREFEINDACTVRMLLQAVSCMHDWNMERDMHLVSEDQTAAEETLPLSDVKLGQGSWRIRKPMKQDEREMYGWSNKKREPGTWEFRLEYISGHEDDSRTDMIRMTRYRGMHPDERSVTMAECNTAMQRLETDGVWYGGRRYLRWDGYVVQPDTLNRKLQAIAASRAPGRTSAPALRRSAGESLISILRARSLEDLKYLIRYNRMNVSYQGKKEAVVQRMAEAMDQPSCWKEILENMSWEDYRKFRSLCVEGEQNTCFRETDIRELFMRGLIASRSRQIVVPSELLQYYGNLLEENGEETLVRRKKAQSAIQLGCILYSFFHVDIYGKLYRILFPKEDSYRQILEDMELLAEEGTDYERRWAFLEPDYIYNVYEIDEDVAVALEKARKGEDLDYYLPSAREAQEILLNGLQFSDGSQQALTTALQKVRSRRYHYPYETEMMVKRIYRMYHLGYDETGILDTLKSDFFSPSDRVDYQSIRTVLEQVKDEVRMSPLRGYRMPEYMQKKAGAKPEGQS